ncbi:MAG: glycyl-radical enzyme activating protein, partial [Oligoflexales bacterium]|nr:glycyl-radical enzyme activating protein [Oligoflexales bacterium]
PLRQLYFIERLCKGCGACLGSCSKDTIEVDDSFQTDRGRCIGCGRCVSLCPYGARRTVGELFDIPRILMEAEKDLPFYGKEGGVTLCGGEPLFQAEASAELFSACRKKGISTVLDTSGFAEPSALEAVLPYTDLVLFDIKHMDTKAHRLGTGSGNERILSNAALVSRYTRMRICIPFVPGFNDNDDNICETARLAKDVRAEGIDLMPVHDLGLHKYGWLGLRSSVDLYCAPKENMLIVAKRLISEIGVESTVGRMI